MFYYVVFDSYENERLVFGPFNSEAECWSEMECSAESVYEHDLKYRDCISSLDKVRSAGRIILTNTYKNDIPDKAMWISIEIPDDEEDKN